MYEIATFLTYLVIGIAVAFVVGTIGCFAFIAKKLYKMFKDI